MTIGRNVDADYDIEGIPSAAIMSDGTIGIADRNPKFPVRIYSSTGSLIKKFRSGEGPDEIPMGPRRIIRTIDDTLIICGSVSSRTLVISATLNVVRVVPPIPAGSSYMVVDKAPNGDIIAVGHVLGDSGVEGVLDGHNIMASRWIRWPPDSSRPRSLLRFAGWIDYSNSSGTFLFGRVIRYAPVGGRLVVAFNDSAELTFFDESGSTLKKVAIDLPVRTVSPEDVRAWVDQVVGEKPVEYQASTRETYKDAMGAKTFPFFDRLVIATDGTIWAQLYRAPLDTAASFLIFDRGGQLVAIAALPPTFRLIGATPSTVLIESEDTEGNFLISAIPIRRSPISKNQR